MTTAVVTKIFTTRSTVSHTKSLPTRSVELNAAASVDPFTKGYVVANASADPVTGESTLGI